MSKKVLNFDFKLLGTKNVVLNKNNVILLVNCFEQRKIAILC